MLKAYLWLQLLMGGLTVFEELNALVFGRGRWQPNWLRLGVGSMLVTVTAFELFSASHRSLPEWTLWTTILVLDLLLVGSFVRRGRTIP
jgi:hypothetical protein